MRVTDAVQLSSWPEGGVGGGDAIVFLPNVRIGYDNVDGQVNYVPLGNDYGPMAVDVAQLLPGGSNPAWLPDSVRAQLVAMDPIASRGLAALSDTSRFTFVGDADVTSNGPTTLTRSTTVTDTTVSTNVYKTSNLDGLLIDVELGDGSGVLAGNTLSTSLTLNGPANVPMYLDKLFGTFAFGAPISPQ